MNILTEKEINIKSLEKEIYDYACKLAAKAFSNYLEALDQELMKSRDKGLLRHKGHRKTCIKTLMGEVEYSRAVYQVMDSEYEKKFVYLLDEYERYILFIVSLFFAALGVTITKRGELGVSPISSIPNVMISRIDSLSLGMWCMSYVPVSNYAVRILLVLGGIVTLGFGVALSVIANVIMNSGEAFVKAVSDKSGIRFGNIKIGFDVGCVIFSILLSLFLFDGKIIGTREGTILTALLTGLIVNFFVKRISSPIDNMLSD